MKIFVQNQGMRKILPQAYNGYSEDKILSIRLFYKWLNIKHLNQKEMSHGENLCHN